MAADVFLSYARAASTAPVHALADALAAAGVSAFVDDREIAYGDPIPGPVVDALLGARVVVVYAEPVYFTRWYCQLEYAAALAGFRRLVDRGAPEADRVAALAHVVVALPPGGVADAELDALPGPVRATNWVPAANTDALVALVRERLTGISAPLRDRLAAVLDAHALASLFTRTAPLPQPLRLAALPGAPPLPVSMPAGTRDSLGDGFVGRADDLWRLHAALAPASTTGGRAARTTAVRGVGGVGKTQLAAEYLRRYGPRHYTGGLFWLDARTDVVAQHHAILRALDSATPDLPALRAALGDAAVGPEVARHLAEALRAVPAAWPVLLVVDDVPEPGMGAARLETWCPAADAVAVLATSRAVVGFRSGGRVDASTLPVLAPADAVAVLTAGDVDARTLAEPEWERIAAWVGHLPLALTLLNRAMSADFEPLPAREVLAATDAGRSPTRELDAAMDALRDVVPRGALRGVSEAFALSYARLPANAQTAARVIAQLAPAAIPTALVEALGGAYADRAVRTRLRSQSFLLPVRADEPPSAVPTVGAMHGVLADFLRAQAAAEAVAAADWAAAVVALDSVMTPDACREPASWPLMRACAPHAERIVATSPGDATIESGVVVVGLANRLTRCFAEWGEPGPARTMAEAALRVATDRLGREHRATLTSEANLANVLWRLGDVTGAAARHERVLDARERLYGAEDTDTLASMNNVATIRGSLGDHAGARLLQERVLVVQTRIFGPENPVTLTTAGNLAETLRMQGDLAAARSRHDEVLKIRTRVLGHKHLATLVGAHNLGVTLLDGGNLADAQMQFERVLEARTRLLGPEHPETLVTMLLLATTLARQGQNEAARARLERALEAYTDQFGPENPAVSAIMCELSNSLAHVADGDAGTQTRDEAARQAAFAKFGVAHPSTEVIGDVLKRELQRLANPAAAEAPASEERGPE